MSQSDLDDGDRDPRRVKTRPRGFIPKLPNSIPIVNDPVRFKMPLNFMSKSSDNLDSTDQSVGDTFVHKKSNKIKSAKFNRRDDPIGSVVKESLEHKRLRFNSSAHILRGEGKRHSIQFMDWGHSQDAQRVSQNVDVQEQSHSGINSRSPRFSGPRFPNFHNFRNFHNFHNFHNFQNSQNFRNSPNFRPITPALTLNRPRHENRTSSKNLRHRLTRHSYRDWPVSSELKDYLDMKRVPKDLRDDSYAERADKMMAHNTIREHQLWAKRPIFQPRGSAPKAISRPFRPDLWYEWKCQKIDGKLENEKFKFKIRSPSSSPKKQGWLHHLSTPVKPKIEVTGWRKRIAEVGFQKFVSQM